MYYFVTEPSQAKPSVDLFGGDSDEEGDLFAVPPAGAPPAHKQETVTKKSEEKPKKKVEFSCTVIDILKIGQCSLIVDKQKNCPVSMKSLEQWNLSLWISLLCGHLATVDNFLQARQGY